jgi:hypothetical protein
LARDYWKEDPDESIRTFGYTLAGASETSVPTLRIRADATEHHLELQLELVDAAGAVVGHEQRLYRNGFPLEPRDSDCKGDGQSEVLDAALYMLHGNLVSQFVGSRFGYSESSPAGRFLNITTTRVSEQDDERLVQFLEPVVERTIEINSFVNPNDPRLPHHSVEKADACKAIVRPATTGVNTIDFTVPRGIIESARARRPYRFIQGTTGREQLLVGMGDRLVCDPDRLYLVRRNLTKEFELPEISKYGIDGRLQYRVVLRIPRLRTRPEGLIDASSLSEEAGVLSFNRIETQVSGSERYVGRIQRMSVVPKQN